MLSSILALQSTPDPGTDQSRWCEGFSSQRKIACIKRAVAVSKMQSNERAAVMTRARVALRVNGWTRAAALVLLVSAAVTSFAQTPAWKPDRNIELILGTPPGSPNDVAARTIEKILRERKIVEVPVVVVNKPGGGLAASWIYLNQHPRNGHFIALSALNLLSNHITGASPLHHSDLTPIAQLFSEYIVFSVKADSPIQTGKDLIERLRKDPASVTIGVSPGPGGANHATMAMVMKAAGIDFRKAKFVFFNAAVDSSTATLGGHVDVCATTSSSVIGHVQSKRMRMIAAAAPKRLGGELAPVPTWKEQGIDVVGDTFRGIVAPKDTPEAQVVYWENVFERLTQSDEWKADVRTRLWEMNYMGSRDSRRYLDAQYAAQKAILTDLGLARP